jgi:hypothetical protein
MMLEVITPGPGRRTSLLFGRGHLALVDQQEGFEVPAADKAREFKERQPNKANSCRCMIFRQQSEGRRYGYEKWSSFVTGEGPQKG